MKITRFFLAVGMLLMSGSVRADLSFEAAITQGNTGNLLEDSTQLSDNYTTLRGGVKFYPSARTELRAALDYTRYSDLSGLSNWVTSIGFTAVPLRRESRLQVYLGGNFNGRIYRDQFRDFSSRNDFDGIISASYRLSGTIQMRTGLSYTANIYTNSWVDDKMTYDIFAGVNMTVLGRSSLDIEAGFSTGNYEYYDRSLDSGVVRADTAFRDDPYYAPNLLHDGDLRFFYVSPRLTRQLGNRTGISVAFQYRSFVDPYEQAIVYGYSTGLLSPWIDVYEGTGITVGIKTYLVPKMIITVNGGYWSKQHLETLDWRSEPNPFEPGSTIQVLSTFGGEDGRGGAFEREDERTRLSLFVQRPIAAWQGLYWEPNLRIEYTNNSSNGPIYDYSHWAVTFALKTQW